MNQKTYEKKCKKNELKIDEFKIHHYAPMIKVLANKTLMDQSAQPEPQAQLVIHVAYPQLHCHHRVSGEGLEVLLITQNQVDPRIVFSKTRAR